MNWRPPVPQTGALPNCATARLRLGQATSRSARNAYWEIRKTRRHPVRDYVTALGLATREAKVATALWTWPAPAFATAFACYELGRLQERFG